jgi:hypothetical protein
MDAPEALEFVRSQGIVLMSGKGPVPKLVEAIAGQAIAGSWWGHPKGKEIFRVASLVGDSPDVLFCPLVAGKVTLVHRRLWPALVTLSRRIGPRKLDRIWSEHTATGAHRRRVEPFPRWVPAEVAREAASLSEPQAEAVLQPWLPHILNTRESDRPRQVRNGRVPG